MTWSGKPNPCLCDTAPEKYNEIDRWTAGYDAIANYGFRHQFPPDKNFTELSKSIGIAEGIAFSMHDHALKGQVNSDFVHMDKQLIKVIATSFTTSSYKPGQGVWDIPENPTKKISADDITIRCRYDEKKPALMEISLMNIWILSKFLYEQVCFSFFVSVFGYHAFSSSQTLSMS